MVRGFGFDNQGDIVTNNHVAAAGASPTVGRTVPEPGGSAGVTAADILPPIGVLVFSVQAGGPAAAAGIKPGDIITGLDGKPVTVSQELNELVAGMAPGQKVTVAITHTDGSTATVTLTIGQYPG